MASFRPEYGRNWVELKLRWSLSAVTRVLTAFVTGSGGVRLSRSIHMLRLSAGAQCDIFSWSDYLYRRREHFLSNLLNSRISRCPANQHYPLYGDT